MFSQVTVCPESASWILVHDSSLRRDRYASYWNAFLLFNASFGDLFFFLIKTNWGFIPVLELLVTSSLGFKARRGRLICTWQRCTWFIFPEIDLWCDTCRALTGQHGGWSVFPLRVFQHFKCRIYGRITWIGIRTCCQYWRMVKAAQKLVTESTETGGHWVVSVIK